MISNASEFLKDFASAKKTQGKIILVADDTGPGMRASGVPIVRMQAMSCDAMAKKLFLDLDWPGEEAVAAARHAQGGWQQLRARKQLCPDHTVCPMSAQARTLPSLTRPRASWRTSC